MTSINKYLDSVGAPGSNERLQAIASLNLGERSEAAKRVLEKRSRRLELREQGLSIEQAALIVAHEYGNNVKK